jgi:hypothetical protein
VKVVAESMYILTLPAFVELNFIIRCDNYIGCLLLGLEPKTQE